MALVTGTAFGALGGFLLFNFPPASIYLGDSGSLGIGFFLGCMALTWANKANTAIGLVAPFFALIVPWLDTLVAMTRRSLTGQPLFAGDQRHLHHRLLRRFSTRDSVLILYAVAGLGAVASLMLADWQRSHTTELVILLFIVLSGVGVQQLGYSEFSQLGPVMRRNSMGRRRSLRASVVVQQCVQELAAASDYEAIWVSLQQACRALEFDGLELRLGPTGSPLWCRRSPGTDPIRDRAGGSGGVGGWTCHIPLGADGNLGAVAFWRRFTLTQPGFLDEFAMVLGETLPVRLIMMQQLPQPSSARARSAGAGA